jgi:uncharacterized protein YjbJ (UPF0337 family)
MSAFSDQVKGNWKQIKGKIKQQYADLTDDQLAYEEGREDEILGTLQEKMGKTKQEVKDWIDSLG